MPREKLTKPFESAELVAYLDGELAENDARTIEKALAEDSTLQAKVDKLAQVWNLLDTLPATRASEEFTARTATSIAVTRAQEANSTTIWRRSSRTGFVWTAWIAGAAFSLLFGYLTMNRWIPDSDNALLNDLPVVENLQQYREIGNVTFLNKLSDSRLFEDELED